MMLALGSRLRQWSLKYSSRAGFRLFRMGCGYNLHPHTRGLLLGSKNLLKMEKAFEFLGLKLNHNNLSIAFSEIFIYRQETKKERLIYNKNIHTWKISRKVVCIKQSCDRNVKVCESSIFWFRKCPFVCFLSTNTPPLSPTFPYFIINMCFLSLFLVCLSSNFSAMGEKYWFWNF